MKNIESVGASRSKRRIWLIVVIGELEDIVNDYAEGRLQAAKKRQKAVDAKIEAAITDYRVKHPEYTRKRISPICVVNERSKEMFEKVFADDIVITTYLPYQVNQK